MFCPRCGTQNPDGSGFCASCGAPLGAAGGGADHQTSPADTGSPSAPAEPRAPLRRVPFPVIIALALMASAVLGGLAGWGVIAVTSGTSAGGAAPSGANADDVGVSSDFGKTDDETASAPNYLLIGYYTQTYGEIEEGLLDAGFTLDSIKEDDVDVAKVVFHADALGLSGEPAVENAAIWVYVEVSDAEQYEWNNAPASPKPPTPLPEDAPCTRSCLWWDIDAAKEALIDTIQQNTEELGLDNFSLLYSADPDLGEQAAEAFGFDGYDTEDSPLLRLRGGAVPGDPLDGTNSSQESAWWELSLNNGGSTTDYFGTLDYYYPQS